MSSSEWQKGYKEVRNLIHNEMGLTKEEIRDVFREIAKEEIQTILSEKKRFITETIREAIQTEMMDAVQDHRYPRVAGSMLYFRGENGRGKDSFKDYVSGVMKEEIIEQMRKGFHIQLEIDKKE